jgi:hypothetical protein
MAELFIESVPSGAEVQIDGEIVGTTPMTIPIYEVEGLAEFRAECLSDGSVVCSWDVLKTRLEDHTVSGLWWDLTQDERRSIAVTATKNTLCFRIYSWRPGQPDCIGGEGEWRNADCGINSVVRIWKFGTDSPDGYHAYWQDPATSIEYCYVPDIKYNLPCYSAGVAQPNWGHEIATIQIGEDVSDINSWIFFQYHEFDIRPGEYQFPVPSHLSISPFGKPPIVEMDIE